MRRTVRAIALGVALLAASMATPAVAAASDQGWVWHVRTVIHCDRPDCAGTELLPPWMKTLRNPFQATSDGHHNFYHRAKIVAIGRPGHPHRCDETLFSKPFSGRCEVRDFGIGYIAPGGAMEGKKDFWVSSETAQFNGGPLMADPFPPYPIDTYQIAYPGYYDTKTLLGSEPEGVRITQDVHRVHR